MKHYCIVDVETTGGRGSLHKITEIAIYKFDGEKIIDEFSSLINPERNIPANITYLTGITNEMVADAPKFYEVARTVVEFMEGCIFVAHNVFFDFNVIRREFSELGYDFRASKLCTVRLARRYFPGYPSYSLGNLCESMKISLENRHRAGGDALATVELFKRILIASEGEDLFRQIQSANKLTLPSGLDREVIENLPEEAGVYYLLDREHKILYIGKSNNIQKRVKNHFRPNMKRNKDIQLKNSVCHIDYQVTGDEWLALLLEANEIKQHRPNFNRSLNRVRFTYGLYICTKDKYHVLKITSAPDENWNPALLYKSKSVAEVTRQQFYRDAFGMNEESLHWDLLKKSLTPEKFNKRLEEIIATQDYPEEEFIISVPLQRKGQRVEVHIVNNRLVKSIWFHAEDEHMSWELKEDPDLKRLVLKRLESPVKIRRKRL